MLTDDLYRRRHSAAHLMAWAVMNLFEDVKLDIGPPTDDGFYYDFDMPHRLTPEDLVRIEDEMKRLAALKAPFVCEAQPRAAASERLGGVAQPYKIERLADIPEDEDITFYTCGQFTDLCRGPHVADTGKIGAFKLMSIAGSYYRGKESNPMLQRIYGTAFATEKELRQEARPSQARQGTRSFQH
jgi:threonyl-tRNA synthetase